MTLVAILGGAAWLVLPGLFTKSVTANREMCLANLSRIGQALESYLRDSGDIWPYVAKLRSMEVHSPPWPTLPVVLDSYVGGRLEVFRCPADRRRLATDSPLAKQFPSKTTWYETEGLSYEWMWGEAYGGQKIGQESLSKPGAGGGREPADQPLLTDFEPFHAGDAGGDFNTLYADLKARQARTTIKK